MDDHGNSLVSEFDYDWKIVKNLLDTGRRRNTQFGVGWSIFNAVRANIMNLTHKRTSILIRPSDEMREDEINKTNFINIFFVGCTYKHDLKKIGGIHYLHTA